MFNNNKGVLILLFAACMTAAAAFAGSPEPEAVRKANKKAEKTCKQIERDHEKMKGEHKLMFKAWQEKSSLLLTEDEEVLTQCKNTLLMEDIAGRHKTLREKHERLFHEMMGH